MEEFKSIEDADHVIVCVSGGKDSSVLMRYAQDTFDPAKLHFVHASLDTDWTVTADIVKRQADFFGVNMNYVKMVGRDGKPKSWLDTLSGPRIDRKTGETKEYQWPDNDNRYCTSLEKTGPLDKFAKKFNGNVLILIGERAEESPKRAKLEAWRPQKSLNKVGRTVVKYSPILKMKESEVWAELKYHQIPQHPCYSWGVSRASCAICIFSSNKEILIAAEKDPQVVQKYLDAEKKISHTFRYKKTKKDGVVKETLADILAGSDILSQAREA